MACFVRFKVDRYTFTERSKQAQKSVFISLTKVITNFFQRKEVESQRQRGEEMDAMLTEKDKKLAEKEAYIVHLQTALAGDQPATPPPQQVRQLTGMWRKRHCDSFLFTANTFTAVIIFIHFISTQNAKISFLPSCSVCSSSVNPLVEAQHLIFPQVTEEGGAMQELQQLVQSLTRKVGESEERFSLLQEQAESLKELLVTEKEQYSQKETMYKQNVGFQSTESASFCLEAPETHAASLLL